jgi:hypothetical protein
MLSATAVRRTKLPSDEAVIAAIRGALAGIADHIGPLSSLAFSASATGEIHNS